MPKIVDHEKMREEIALKAASVFLEHGYKSTGMRQLCSLLGMSKSAVYHYFKSKDELFRAATESIANHDAELLSDRPTASEATQTQKIDNFVCVFDVLACRYFSEMKLVHDYIEVIGIDAVSQDSCMQMTNQKYQRLLADYVDASQAEVLYTLMLGLLTQSTLKGQKPALDYIQAQVKPLLTH